MLLEKKALNIPGCVSGMSLRYDKKVCAKKAHTLQNINKRGNKSIDILYRIWLLSIMCLPLTLTHY